jgi:UDP-glucose 4-epimerase
VTDKRALVTGAKGFIGAYVCAELARTGYIVDGIGHGADGAASVRTWTAGPVDAAHLPVERYELVIHCAGGSSVAQSIADPQGELAKTVSACEAILEWMRTGPSRDARLVFVSSGAVYGAADTMPIAEEVASKPVSPYGEHKQICEELCRTHARAHGTSVAIVRLFSVYGPGLARQLLWDAARKVAAGAPRFAGSGNERRDWLYVTDAARLLVLAGSHATSTAPTFNGGSGTGTRVAEVVRMLLAELDAKATPEFDGSTRAGDPPDYIADITRARALGWSPTVLLPDGLREYARWFATCR